AGVAFGGRRVSERPHAIPERPHAIPACARGQGGKGDPGPAAWLNDGTPDVEGGKGSDDHCEKRRPRTQKNRAGTDAGECELSDCEREAERRQHERRGRDVGPRATQQTRVVVCAEPMKTRNARGRVRGEFPPSNGGTPGAVREGRAGKQKRDSCKR